MGCRPGATNTGPGSPVDRVWLHILPPTAHNNRDALRPESGRGFSIKGILVDIYTSCRAQRTRPLPPMRQ